MATTAEKRDTFMARFESVKHAARRIGKRRAYIMALVEAGKLTAYQIGGTSERPILGVVPAECDAAVADAIRYVPKVTRPRQRGRRPERPVKLDPAVKC